MLKEIKDQHSDRAIWFMAGAVFLCVLLVLIAVFNHDKEKPQSPQALVAAAFGDTFRVKEWKPAMGPKPFMYHPAGFNSLVWRPLPSRANSAPQWGTGSRVTLPGSGGRMNNTAVAPNAGQALQPGQP